MHTPNLGRPLDNKLLSTLPRDQFDLLAPHLTTVSLSQGEMLVGAGEEFDHVYFPHSGMLSLLAVLRDGKAIETATVGREGVVGAMAGFGLYRSQVRVIVQLPMAVSRISATKFRKATANSDAIRPVDRWDNRLVCIAFPRQKLQVYCSTNWNRRFHVCASPMNARKATAGHNATEPGFKREEANSSGERKLLRT